MSLPDMSSSAPWGLAFGRMDSCHPFVGPLLGHTLHDGPKQGELVTCVLAVPGQQGGHYARIETH